LTARELVASTMDLEAPSGLLDRAVLFDRHRPRVVGWFQDEGVEIRVILLERGSGQWPGSGTQPVLRRHTDGSGVRHPFAALGGMNLFGATVVGAIRRLDPRAGS